MASNVRYVMQLQRSPVIIELGSLFTKVGFAGSAAPMAILPTRARINTGKTLSPFSPMKDEVRAEILCNLFTEIYVRHLLCNAKDRKVVVLLNPFEAQDLEMSILSVLLNALEVPSVSFVAPHMTIFPSIGVIHTGLIIDIGKMTRIIPVSHNCSLVGLWEVLPQMGYAGLVESLDHPEPNEVDFRRNFPRVLNLRLASDTAAGEILEKVEMKQLTQDLLGRRIHQQDFRPFPDLNTDLHTESGRVNVMISGRFLEETMEIFHRPNIDGQNLTFAILDVITKCPVDLRRLMMENIIVVGGLAGIRNFLPRLNAELTLAAQQHPYCDKLVDPQFKFINCGSIPTNTLAWRGCSVLTQANYYPDTASVTRDDLLLRTSGKNVAALLKEWCYVGRDRQLVR